jgi:hypothetical protein
MDQEVADAIETLKQQGIVITVDPSGREPGVYVATAPNGEKYEFDSAGLLNLKAKEKLDLEGLQDVHLAKKDTPHL